MEPWALRGMQRWPNVPALFGWLGLDTRGRWTIQGELITRPQIIETINRNYEADEHGRWFFQNGPQRGFVTLANTPLILRLAAPGGELVTHTDLDVNEIRAVYMDERGGLTFVTEHGPGLLVDADFEWALERMKLASAPLTPEVLETVLAQPSATTTTVRFQFGRLSMPIERLDMQSAPQRLHFVRDPQPFANERYSTRMAD